MLEDFQRLARTCAGLQHKAAVADRSALRRHISDTLRRCLPAAAVTHELVEGCLLAILPLPQDADPMHTGAIITYAGQYLLATSFLEEPLLQRLQRSAQKLLSVDKPASRDDLRLVTLDALYHPGILPDGIHNAYIRRRLGLNGPRLSNEEIAASMHMRLVDVHEMEAAILTALSYHHDGGSHA